MSAMIRKSIQFSTLGNTHSRKMEEEFNSTDYVFNYLSKRTVLVLEWSYWRSHPRCSQTAFESPPGRGLVTELECSPGSAMGLASCIFSQGTLRSIHLDYDEWQVQGHRCRAGLTGLEGCCHRLLAV